MTPEDFVALFEAEKESLLDMYFSAETQTAVAAKIKAISLSPEQGSHK
jgi:hypothetical protein